MSNNKEFKIVVDPETQTACLYQKVEYSNWDNWNKINSYIVSTGKNGVGCESESGKTPYGNFEISETYGDGAEKGSIFKGRVFTGDVWTPDPENPLNQGENAITGGVMTRILRLSGLDEENLNTYSRYIYLHATKSIAKVGTPISGGCISTNHDDIIELFNTVSVGTKVEIFNREYNKEKAKIAQAEIKKSKPEGYPNIF